ncbi:hypothetical protein LB505_002737 [Fusarium chuoi]|nr:hypothetical protein LB505_002737 [Fusarium chuoi]
MADAAAPPTEQVSNLHLDEVTGEKVSKTELKKRQKARQKEEEKKKKAAERGPAPAPKKAAGVLRDSIEEHQQAPRDQEPQPLPS